jgi:NAD(P)H-dependent flavin oxidoreductase YrpB (nitropropane dioxygenase family)
VTRFDPSEFLAGRPSAALTRPRFLAIIASNTLATFLAKSVHGRPDGFVVEGPTAGGHNAPPRSTLVLDDEGEPVYGPRDHVNLDAIAALGIPFWLAGGYGSPDRLREALEAGAAGVQVGSAFALCEESGIEPSIKHDMVRRALAGTLGVRTDPRASPSGYPFKVVALDDTVSDPEAYASRPRLCDLGALRNAYLGDSGAIGYRCPAEPEADYVAKGGALDDTEGRKCLCNGLLATIGLGQVRERGPEPPIVTAGDDLERAVRALTVDGRAYSASEVVDYLLSTSSVS